MSQGKILEVVLPCRKLSVPEGLTEAEWGELVDAGQRATIFGKQLSQGGERSLEAIAQSVIVLLQTGGWRRRVLMHTDQYGNLLPPERQPVVVEFDAFEDFFTCRPVEGMGERSVAILRNLLRDNKEALDLLDQAIQGQHGGNHNPTGENQHKSEDCQVSVDNVNVDQTGARTAEPRPTGNSTAAALRRLRKDRPDLHAKVLAGEVSPNGAMVLAGFRERTLTVPADPEKAARVLRRHFRGEGLARLVALLLEATGGEIKE